MKARKIIAICGTGFLVVGSLAGCNGTSINPDSAIVLDESIETVQGLDLSAYTDSWVYNEAYGVYALENIVYCANPVDATLQSMNIYVPAAYMNEDGTLNLEGSITNSNGVTYTAETAPIIYANGVWGYSEATPSTIDYSDKGNANRVYTDAGYVFVSVGSRGKESVSEEGTYIGKAPDGLVDLKAGVRFLKYNDSLLAGSSDKIISVGQSAGGGMSALLGSTGNSEDYTPYLEEIGAIMSAKDDVYGAMAYCPITDLENADMTYEWMFQSDIAYAGSFRGNRGNNEAEGTSGGKGAAAGKMMEGTEGELTEEQIQEMRKQGMTGGAGMASETELTAFQQALSKDLATIYPAYVTSLNLGLDLSEDGRSGSYYEAMMVVISTSLNDYINRKYSTLDEKVAYIESLNEQGNWVNWNAENETASITDIDAFVTYYLGRMKAVSGFDAFDLSAQENQLFGTSTNNLAHFSTTVAELISLNDYSTLEGYDESLVQAYQSVLEDTQLKERIYLMNPMNYIGTDEVSTISPYFRIRVGTQDADTAFVTAFNLAKSLENEGTVVDYEMVWGQGHGMADYSGELLEWIDEISR